jgi:hypothetical protein
MKFLNIRKIKIKLFYYKIIGYLRITDLGIARIWKPENN